MRLPLFDKLLQFWRSLTKDSIAFTRLLEEYSQRLFKQTRTVDAALRQFPVNYREGAEPKIDQVKKIRLRAVNDLLSDGWVIKTSVF